MAIIKQSSGTWQQNAPQLMQEINKKLSDLINKTNLNKSSAYRKFLPHNADYMNELSHFGSGSYTKKSLKNYIHNILIRIIFGNTILKTKTYNAYKSIFDEINRYVDADTITHIFTFEKLKEYVNPKSICVIGDGKINGILGAHLTFPKAKIYSVNLAEVLINDNLILEKTNIDLKKSVTLVEDLNIYSQNNVLFLIPSNNKKFLLNRNIELFINIASFQEMTTNEIKEYFEIIKNNKSKLYCCNREYKKLPGGEELYFKKYPFSNSKKIFWEDCPWYQKFYSLKPPFIHKYDGNFKHCLVDFHND